jgi:carbon-monoxide dehydrogenase medium subunit
MGVSCPVWSGRTGFAIEELARRQGDFALAGAAVGVELDADDRIARCAIGLIGLGSTPLRAPEAEALAVGRAGGDADTAELGRAALAALPSVPSDLHGSAAYRTRVGAAMVDRALAAAIREAREEAS